MTNLVRWICGQCGTEQAMPEDTKRVLLASSATFYCIHGHARHYPQGKSQEEKLRQERDRLKQSIAYEQDRRRAAEEEAEHQRRRANGYKGHATRITKRAKAGVCPCCNQHFAALERHMATKHPEFTPDCPEPLRVIDGGKAA